MPQIALHKRTLPVPLFRRLALAVREVGVERLEESYTTTFWFPLGAEPGNIVEEAITRLWPLACPGPRCVGAEWWLGRLGYGQSLPLHFDRDMTLEKRTGQRAHPLWSSILYLNRFPSSSTVILDQVLGHDRKSLVPPVATSGKAVPPVPNQYVVYPGNLHHGVLADKAAQARAAQAGKAKRPRGLRLTLLINFWDHRPLPPICRDYDGTVYGALRKHYLPPGRMADSGAHNRKSQAAANGFASRAVSESVDVD